jgi:scyllo-inositol 2-dehydrogenase (NADP+)
VSGPLARELLNHHDRDQPGGVCRDPRFNANGQAADLSLPETAAQERSLKAGVRPEMLGDQWGRESAGNAGTIVTAGGARPVEPERGRWDQFYRRIAATVLTGCPPPASSADAIHGLKVIQAARLSARRRREVHIADLEERDQ